MKPSLELLDRAEYAAIVRPLLPPEAFVPSKRNLWQAGLHLGVIGLGMWGIVAFPNIAARFVCSAIIGHSLTCLVFLAHEMSHGGMLKRSPVRYPMEVLFWGLNLIPATMWRKLHNENHHVHANTAGDPDRFFLQSEIAAPGGFWRRWYTRFFLPHRFTSRWNLGVGFHFVTYILRHLAAVFYPGQSRPAICTCKPDYRPSERRWIMLELACIAGFQLAIYFAVGQSVVAWLFAGPIALLFTSTFAMSYIWTNHYLHEFAELHDPLCGSTSIDVPPVFDHLHNYFSYHTEHHLFPSMSSQYYPLVSKILRERFPDRYHRVTYREAWRQLWKREPFLADLAPTDPHVDEAAASLNRPHGEFSETPSPVVHQHDHVSP